MSDEPKKQSIFRQQALDYLSTLQTADDLIPVPASFAWLALLAIWLVLAVIIIWLFFGVVRLHLPGRGILLSENLAIVYVAATRAPPLQQGMSVWISSIANGAHYGQHFSGKIVQVDNIPVTPDQMYHDLKNPVLVNYFLTTGPQLRLSIQLDKSVYGSLAKGSLIEARIIVRQETPLAMMFSSR